MKRFIEINKRGVDGWIKLYRKSLKSSVFDKPIVWKVWCWCLLKATHVEYKMPFKGADMVIESGQFVTGIEQASYELGMNPQQYRTAIKYLKSTNRITSKSTNKFTVITVENWDNFQSENLTNQQTNKPITNQQPTNNKPITTYKNNKNNKNKDYSPNSDEFRLASLLFNLIIERKPDYKKPDLQKWATHIGRMIRLDKRTPARIEEIIRWCQADEGDGAGSWRGWQNNILSTEKLRKKFDMLELRKNERNTVSAQGGPGQGQTKRTKYDRNYGDHAPGTAGEEINV